MLALVRARRGDPGAREALDAAHESRTLARGVRRRRGPRSRRRRGRMARGRTRARSTASPLRCSREAAAGNLTDDATRLAYWRRLAGLRLPSQRGRLRVLCRRRNRRLARGRRGVGAARASVRDGTRPRRGGRGGSPWFMRSRDLPQPSGQAPSRPGLPVSYVGSARTGSHAARALPRARTPRT